MELHELTLAEARRLLDAGECSSAELTDALIDRIGAVEDDVRAYLALTPDMARERAQSADDVRATDDTGPLLGLPIAIKDVLSTRGVPTTCGSRILEGYKPPYNATAVQRLADAGTIMLGKTNTDEFAMGSSTENSGYYTTHNPWDLNRVPGGSSGGSAAAVAADECLAALGTDTGGSVRQPASLCGVVGLKPTYGRVSRYGLIAFASSLDQVGTLTKTVTDAAILLEAIAGHDPNDSTSSEQPVPAFSEALTGNIAGIRVGVVREWLDHDGLDAGVAAAVHTALKQLETLGADIVEVELPHSDYGLSVYYLLATAEASSNLARYDGVRYGLRIEDADDIWDLFAITRGAGFGPEVKRRIMLGTYALSAGYYDQYYKKAQKVRTLIKQDFDEAFADVDVIAGPTSPVPAFKIGERTDDPLQMYLADVFTITLNLAGLPGISIPCGMTDGLPVGLQFIGKAWDEAALLRISHAYEQSTDWHTQKPPL